MIRCLKWVLDIQTREIVLGIRSSKIKTQCIVYFQDKSAQTSASSSAVLTPEKRPPRQTRQIHSQSKKQNYFFLFLCLLFHYFFCYSEFSIKDCHVFNQVCLLDWRPTFNAKEISHNIVIPILITIPKTNYKRSYLSLCCKNTHIRLPKAIHLNWQRSVASETLCSILINVYAMQYKEKSFKEHWMSFRFLQMQHILSVASVL